MDTYFIWIALRPGYKSACIRKVLRSAEHIKFLRGFSWPWVKVFLVQTFTLCTARPSSSFPNINFGSLAKTRPSPPSHICTIMQHIYYKIQLKYSNVFFRCITSRSISQHLFYFPSLRSFLAASLLLVQWRVAHPGKLRENKLYALMPVINIVPLTPPAVSS